MPRPPDPLRRLIDAPVAWLPAWYLARGLDGLNGEVARFPGPRGGKYVTLTPATARRLGVQMVEARGRKTRARARRLVALPPGQPLYRWRKVTTAKPWEEGPQPIEYPERPVHREPEPEPELPPEPEPELPPEPENRTQAVPISAAEAAERLWPGSAAGGLAPSPQPAPGLDPELCRLLREAEKARLEREKRRRARRRAQRRR